MPQAERSIEINAPIEHVFDVITDYKKYVEFIPEMQSVEIEQESGNEKIVTYTISIFKLKITYTLRLTETRPTEVKWTLIKSNKLKNVDGYWRLEKIDDKRTRATYGQVLEVKGLVPKSVVNTLANVNLPNMLKQFKDRCESTYKG